VFSPNTSDRLEDMSFEYFLPLSFGRVTRLSDWPPVTTSVATVNWLYSNDAEGTAWNAVKFTEWEFERNHHGGREIVHHKDEVCIDRFMSDECGKPIVVTMTQKKGYVMLDFDSCRIVECMENMV
jgi:hypothetical protein